MNFKTTLLLAMGLAGLTVIYLWRPQPDFAAVSQEPVSAATSSVAARKLVDPPLGEISKITIAREGEDEWTFEKGSTEKESGGDSAAGQGDWRMTSPKEMKATRWALDSVGREIGNLEYEISYGPSDAGGISRAQAGLEPAMVTVTLTDADGRSAAIDIGQPASANETYVGLVGDDRVIVANRSLGRLIKTSALEYRDQLIWTFDAKNATHLEIIDQSDADHAVTYAFSRSDSGWLMESPASAQATGKVDEMLRAISRLRAIKWHDDRQDRWSAYGLKDPMLTVRVTVEEVIEKDKAPEDDSEATAAGESEDPAPATEKKTTTYALYVSSQSPIGESTKSFVRAGDDAAVGTIMKSLVDRLIPKLTEWRDMRVTTANVTTATRIELRTPEGSADLVRRNKQWFFQPEDAPADSDAVGDLLGAIKELSAVAFVDGEDVDLASMGLNDPRADIRVTIPGLDEPERLVVGGFTDERLKRLVYVRRNQTTSVAKVRTSAVASLVRGPTAYRDRMLVDIASAAFSKLVIESPMPCGEGRSLVTLERTEASADGDSADGWAISSPLPASVRKDRVDGLVTSLGSLQANAVVAEAGEASAYGLHDPTIRLTITYQPPIEYRLEEESPPKGDTGDSDAATDETENEGKPRKLVPREVQPPAKSIELFLTEHEGKHFAKRADRPMVYEVSSAIYKELSAELRLGKVFRFDETKVKRLAIRDGSVTHVFDRKSGGWAYGAEPDLPIDGKKVEDLLLRVLDLSTDRFVDHSATSLTAFDEATAAHEVVVTLDDGTERVLRVAAASCGEGSDAGHFAIVDDEPGVFLLSADTILRFKVSLDDLESD